MNRTRPQTNYAGAIYGAILSMAVISTASADASLGPITVASWAAATALVFYLAHVYASIVAAGFARPREAGDLIVRAMKSEWPLVQGSLIPAAAMFLAPIGLVSDEKASYAAIWVGVGFLFVAGVRAGGGEGLGWGRRLVIGSINALIGLLIVALKIFVH